MHALARARRQSGKLDEALAAYRVLVPRASLMPSRRERAGVLLEAAHVAMAGAAKPGPGVERHLDEALAYLREAGRDPHHRLRLDVALSLVLALDRAGRTAQADAVLAEQRGTRAWADDHASDDSESAPAGYLASARDHEALMALALERHDATRAAEHWRRHLAGNDGSFRAAAEARLRRLGADTKRKR
jgi:hypothetical protein